ncbi:MAG: peptide chain release factor N(5)-glutamine methyltransferase [Thermoguttaceae bacterium]
MSHDETWNVKRLLEWTTDFFRKHEIDSPRLDAEVLLAAAMGVDRVMLYVSFETEPNESVRSQFRDWVKRRAAGEPVAYLVGYKEFFSLKFAVNRATLVPRSETEQLVVEVIEAVRNDPSLRRIAEIGTGSGCIAIALAVSLAKKSATQGVIITASDISPDALVIAKQNAKTHNVASLIEFVESDLLASLENEYDIIVANLPYVSDAEYDGLQRDVRDYEPKSALVGGPTGAEVIARLVSESTSRLRVGGLIFVEHSPMNAEQVASLFAGSDWCDVTTIADHNDLPRLTKACRTGEQDGNRS